MPLGCPTCREITAGPPERSDELVLDECGCGVRWAWDPRARTWFPNTL